MSKILIDEATVKLALNALLILNSPSIGARIRQDNAIDVLREALPEQQASVQQELASNGWKIVPIEPTNEMMRAFFEAAGKWVNEEGADEDVYIAMLEAAPNSHECTRSHPHENMDAMCELRTEIARLANENARLKAQQAPVQQEACPTCGEYEPRTGTCGTSPNDKRALCNRNAPQPAQQEPVGYVAENGLVDWNLCAPPIFTDLYTSPSNQPGYQAMAMAVTRLQKRCLELEGKQPARKPLMEEEMFEAIRPLYSSDKAARLAVSHSKDEYRAIEAKLKEKKTC